MPSSSYEALKIAIQGDVEKFAKALRLHYKGVYKWMVPVVDYSHSGALNPVDRVEGIIETALKIRSRREDALAPLLYLNRHFGLITIDMPHVKGTLPELNKGLLKTIEEFADLAGASSAALQDGKISRREKRQILEEGNELQEQLATFMKMIEEAE